MYNFPKIIKEIKNIQLKYVYFVLLIVILIVITFYRLKIQMDIGALYDTYDFLANAAEFSGQSIGYTDIRPPLLSLLTSIIFRFDGLSIAPIFYIEAIIDVIGVIGLFFLLKQKFNDLNSFLGSLLYTTFPIVLTYIGVGFADLSSISISIWAIYFTVLAVKKDNKFFLVSFPVAMLAFLTKFNQALIIFPIFFYILINWSNIKNRRNIIFGMIIAGLIFVPLLLFYTLKYGNPLFPFFDFFKSSTGSQVNELYFDYNQDPYFYIKLLPLMIGNGALLLIFVIVGALLAIYLRLLMKRSILPKIKFNVKDNLFVIITIVTLSVIFLFSWGVVSYLVSEIIFFFILFSLYKLLKSGNKFDLDFLFISWFVTFLIFLSLFMVKDIRYFLMILPSFSYLLIRTLEITENQLGLIRKRKLTVYLAPLIVVVLLLSTAFYLPTIPEANTYDENLNINIQEASNWLINYDPDYKSQIIFSDIWPHSAWFLQMNIQKMPEFKGNEKYYLNIENYNPTNDDSIAANNFLIENNAYYYFSIRNWTNLDNFTVIKKFGSITIYKIKQ